MIIAFSGTDGAGKSTQIKGLSDRLVVAGHSVRCVWARGGYTPLMLAAKTVALRLLGRRGDSNGFNAAESAGYAEKRAGLMRRPLVARVWLTVAILDLALFYGVYVRVLSLMGQVVLCDRYIGDTRIDFTRNFPAQFKENGPLWRLLRLMVANPHVYFVLTVPVAVSMERSALKNEPFPDSQETLEFRLECYRSFAEFDSDSVRNLDGTGRIEAVAAEIDSALSSVRPGLSRL